MNDVKMTMRELKKAALTERIEFSDHAYQRLDKRGYVEADVKACILSGEIKERQAKNRNPSVLIAGEDLDGLPILVSIGMHEIKPNVYTVITVMPPIDKERFDRVI